MITSKEIGNKFKEERESQGLTLAAAAQESRIHQKVLKDIENGVYDRIGGLYIKSFMKKYSIFLKMNLTEILKLYEEVSLEMPNKEFIIEKSLKKDDSEEYIESNSKKIQFIFIGVLSVILIILVFVFVGMLKTRINSKQNDNNISALVIKNKDKTVSKAVKKIGFFNRKENKDEYSLKVKAVGDVWVQIKTEDEQIYAGVIVEGNSRSWDLNSPVNIWTGKAENLEYIINGKNLGVFSKGVVKNIELSSEGIKIDNNWVSRTKR